MPITRDGNPTTSTQTQNGRSDQSTITELVAGIVNDAQTLIKQQFAMLRAEVKQDVSRATQASKFLGIGAGLAGIGTLFLAIGVVYLLHSLFGPDLALWACWAIVGGVLTVAGIAAFFVGRNYLKTVTPLPDQTINAFQENLSWIANHPS
ncbi:MAG: phage holin family protein [Gemmataceae bacterium]